MPGGDLAVLQRHFGAWHPGLHRVLDRAAEGGGAGISRNDLYDLAEPLPSYVSGRVALIGDAAHAMTPDLGRGACEALIDAVTLAGELTARARVEDALAAYDTARRRPTQRLARAARLMNRAVHTRRPLAPVRNAAMRLFLTVGRTTGVTHGRAQAPCPGCRGPAVVSAVPSLADLDVDRRVLVD
ncbi:FAD-dependent monooxygenase [Streptomyces afghaniensis]|uniref:FAD-dependent monooxygenase n=1 Tax=Streptomyces afghaniensis TaxID=66865 RepID=UPI0037B4DE6A